MVGVKEVSEHSLGPEPGLSRRSISSRNLRISSKYSGKVGSSLACPNQRISGFSRGTSIHTSAPESSRCRIRVSKLLHGFVARWGSCLKVDGSNKSGCKPPRRFRADLDQIRRGRIRGPSVRIHHIR